MDTPSGIKDSIPAWIKFSVQAPGEIPYNGIYYDPPEEARFPIQFWLYMENLKKSTMSSLLHVTRLESMLQYSYSHILKNGISYDSFL